MLKNRLGRENAKPNQPNPPMRSTEILLTSPVCHRFETQSHCVSDTSHPVKTQNNKILLLALVFAALALNLSVIQQAEAASWVTNGPMNTAR